LGSTRPETVMPSPATADEFLDLVRKSGVVDEARVNSFVETAGGRPSLSEPSKLAGLLVKNGLLTYFQADQILQGKWKRFFIGKYKVLERIGTGGMGQVFLCEHKLMRRRVAVKVLPAVKAADPAALDRFYREARAVAALDQHFDAGDSMVIVAHTLLETYRSLTAMSRPHQIAPHAAWRAIRETFVARGTVVELRPENY